MKSDFLPPAARASFGPVYGDGPVLHRRRRVFFTPIAALALLVFVACGGTGTVTTSTGQVVSATTVAAQDTAADVLQSLDTAYKAAVVAHDALAATEDPAVHAKHRQILLDVYAGLRGSWDALIAWKGASTNPAPANILASAVPAARDFIPLAVQLGALKQPAADSILKYLNAFFPAGP